MLNHLIRYEPVARYVEALPGRALLEVGSGSRGISSYLSARWELTACDVSFADYGAPVTGQSGRARRVEASVLRMPFAHAAFDVVVALDLLEHLAPEDRPQALAELYRVTSRYLIVACPTGLAALRSDERLARFYERVGRTGPTWLDEHRINGFPEVSTLVEHLGACGELTLVPNETLRAHALVSRLEALPMFWRLTGVLSQGIAACLTGPRWVEWVTRRILPFPGAAHWAPAYRTIAILSKRAAEA